MNDKLNDLMRELLSKPTGDKHPQKADEKRPARPSETITVSTRSASGERVFDASNAPEDAVSNDGAISFLKDQGLNPEEWIVTGFRKSEWESGDRTLQSVRYTYAKACDDGMRTLITDEDIDGMVERLRTAETRNRNKPSLIPTENGAYVVLIADAQIGKMESPESIERVFDLITKAANRLCGNMDISRKSKEIVVAFGGDMLENFLSGGGSQVWRTKMTLTEQIRVVRRLMMHAVTEFAPLADRVVFTTCSSNHGQAVRIAGTGETRMDDDHDIEALIAVADAVALVSETNKEYQSAEFVVPHDDSGVTVVSAGGSTIGLAHGHQWRKDKHWEWLANAAISRFPIGDVDILLAGHYHSLRMEERSAVTFIQAPSCETRSSWFVNSTNIDGHPGIVTFVAIDGAVHDFEVIR